MRNKPRRIILNCGAALLSPTFVCYLSHYLSFVACEARNGVLD